MSSVSRRARSDRFDSATRPRIVAQSRRSLVRALTGIALGGALAPLLGFAGTAADTPRKGKNRRGNVRNHSRKSRRARGPSPSCASAEAIEMLSLVNAWRAENGVAPLVRDAVLNSAAATKSAAMASTGVLQHEIGGVDAGTNLANHGYPVETWWGENIAWGHGTAQAAFTWWKTSPSHNANMLSPNFQAMGLVVARAPGTTWGDYWTQTFGALALSPVTGC